MNFITFNKNLALLTSVAVVGLLSITSKVNAASLTINSSSIEVTQPEDGKIFWVKNPQDSINIISQGKGSINYTVITDNNPVVVQEDVQLFLDEFNFFSSTPFVVPKNTKTERTLSLEPSLVASLGVGKHEAKLTFSLASSLKNFSKSDVNKFEIKSEVPEPVTILGSGTALAFGFFIKRKHLRNQAKAKL